MRRTNWLREEISNPRRAKYINKRARYGIGRFSRFQGREAWRSTCATICRSKTRPARRVSTQIRNFIQLQFAKRSAKQLPRPYLYSIVWPPPGPLNP